MSDEIMADAVTEAAVETPEVQDVKTFTQEELDRIVADFRIDFRPGKHIILFLEMIEINAEPVRHPGAT